MKIAYFAWGSLLWDSEGLNLKNIWKNTNIFIPVNFSRISDNKNGRLTLVIDNINGISNSIYYAITKTNNLNIAIKNLKIRERTISKYIGYINLINNTSRYSDRLTKDNIEKFKLFAVKNNIDAIVWTDLQPNFKNFSTENALKYIDSKKEDISLYNKIIEYIYLCYTYGNIQTPITKKIFQKDS